MFKQAQSVENGTLNSQIPITLFQQLSSHYQTYFIYTPTYFTPLKHVLWSKAPTFMSLHPSVPQYMCFQDKDFKTLC